MKLSKTTLTLFGAAVLFYAVAWTEIASALAGVGVLFELGMYVSMFSDQKQQKKQGSADIKVAKKNG